MTTSINHTKNTTNLGSSVKITHATESPKNAPTQVNKLFLEIITQY